MLSNTIIGVSGVAGSGKDTFCSLLSERVPCKRYALADELKSEVNKWCQFHYSINSINCSREQKELIRNFLVFHASFKRKKTNGRYWIERIHDKIIKEKFHGFKIITDIRYDEYEQDELSWLKEELGGIHVHISQYSLIDDKDGKLMGKLFKKPANEEEERNEEKLKNKSDFQIEWEFLKEGQISELYPYIDKFIEWFQKKQKASGLRPTTL